ncbi:MAG: ATP-binding protein [Bacteroidia bacterium]|nr:ATP-binding protein [Bacteroidia bacterium]
MASANPLLIEEDIQGISQIETIVTKVVHRFNLSNDMQGNILISLTEAVNNAIIHGNKNDKNKCVKLKITQESTKLAFSVSDEGTGFDHTKLPDPTLPENLLKLSGRGVFLIHQLCDAVTYQDQGRTVEMHFHICTL